MANDYFSFKKFTVQQARCAMKVGTDGTLLGCWARGGKHVLDIGTGTGLIALIMAQRFPEASVTGIDIDDDAVEQAKDNVKASPFASRVSILHEDVRLFDGHFDAIVCNPPFFENALVCPSTKRTMARHTITLSYDSLIASAWRMLDDEGEFSMVIPFDCKERVMSETVLAGFFLSRECAVKTNEKKPARRFLLAFRKHSSAFEREEGVIGSEWYQQLTKDFYL